MLSQLLRGAQIQNLLLPPSPILLTCLRFLSAPQGWTACLNTVTTLNPVVARFAVRATTYRFLLPSCHLSPDWCRLVFVLSIHILVQRYVTHSQAGPISCIQKIIKEIKNKNKNNLESDGDLRVVDREKILHYHQLYINRSDPCFHAMNCFHGMNS